MGPLKATFIHLSVIGYACFWKGYIVEPILFEVLTRYSGLKVKEKEGNRIQSYYKSIHNLSSSWR
jgi:hypothetical protein